MDGEQSGVVRGICYASVLFPIHDDARIERLTT